MAKKKYTCYDCGERLEDFEIQSGDMVEEIMMSGKPELFHTECAENYRENLASKDDSNN